jgi:hypothetical protein
MKKHFIDSKIVSLLATLVAMIVPIYVLKDSERYWLNPHAFGPLLASYFVVALSVLIVNRKLDKQEKYYFYLVTLSIFFWLWTLALGEFCRYGHDNLALIWFRLGSCGPILIPICIYAFSANFLGINRQKILILGYILASSFICISFFTPYFLVGVHYYVPWGYFPKWKFLPTIPYFAYFVTYMGLAQAEYWYVYKSTDSQRIRNQIKYLFIAFSISYLGSIDFLPTFGYRVYPFGYVAIFGWWLVLAYAIFKHRLLDISVIIRKTLVYSTVVGSLTIVYLTVVVLFARLFEGVSGYQTVFSSAVAAGLITFCFQPLRKRIQSFVDAKFFRQYVDREEKLYELSREVITHTTPEAMGQALVNVLQATLHPKMGALYLKSRDGSGYIPAAAWGEGSNGLMPEDNPLARYFLDHPQPFVQEIAEDMGASQDTRTGSHKERKVA